ncbi:CAP domain-containing protein [Nocardia gipuzkoensis]
MAEQTNWRFCPKCFGLYYDGDERQPKATGRCPGGDTRWPGHEPYLLNFALPHDVPQNAKTQRNWRFCVQCFGMFYNGDTRGFKGRCPAPATPGGGHDPVQSYDFVLPYGVAQTAKTQRDWRFCVQCFGMFYNGDMRGFKGRCPAPATAGGGHDAGPSFDFVLAHQGTRSCQTPEERFSAYADTVVQAGTGVSYAEHALLYLVNGERQQRGLVPLCYNIRLAAEARAHSENWAPDPKRTCPPVPSGRDWAGCGHWDSRTGYDWPEERIAKSGYGSYKGMNENTFWGFGVSDGDHFVPAGWAYAMPKSAVYWWMNHDPANNYANNGHRGTILDPRYTEAGPGIAAFTHSGQPAATYTMMFGFH